MKKLYTIMAIVSSGLHVLNRLRLRRNSPPRPQCPPQPRLPLPLLPCPQRRQRLQPPPHRPLVLVW